MCLYVVETIHNICSYVFTYAKFQFKGESQNISSRKIATYNLQHSSSADVYTNINTEYIMSIW